MDRDLRWCPASCADHKPVRCRSARKRERSRISAHSRRRQGWARSGRRGQLQCGGRTR